MKYQKAKMIAKNLPSGSYAAGCPTYYSGAEKMGLCMIALKNSSKPCCKQCERAQ